SVKRSKILSFKHKTIELGYCMTHTLRASHTLTQQERLRQAGKQRTVAKIKIFIGNGIPFPVFFTTARISAPEKHRFGIRFIMPAIHTIHINDGFLHRKQSILRYKHLSERQKQSDRQIFKT
ncbi:hypothetical protein, partial [Bacteroides heparinolyticus]|uniref:hypothetical protein n=1 Tax=Prevotella heparinolytica TaxID=28113 RepID=UPI0035A1176E